MENTLTPHKKMATKIEGWIGNTAEQWLKDNYSGAILFRKTEAVGELSATLVIHDGPPERVYTESEVGDILADALQRLILANLDDEKWQALSRIVFDVAEKNGIQLPEPL